MPRIDESKRKIAWKERPGKHFYRFDQDSEKYKPKNLYKPSKPHTCEPVIARSKTMNKKKQFAMRFLHTLANLESNIDLMLILTQK